MSFNLMMVNDRFTTVIDNKSYTVNHDHPKFDELLECVKNEDAEGFKNLFTTEHLVKSTFSETGVELANGQVLYNGEPVHNSLTKRIIEFAERDLPVDGMLNFLGNLMDNPSRRAVNELYGFLEHRNMPITSDGCFLAYKAVQDNYLDKYSSTFDNSVGAVMEMPRNEVDDVASNTCSVGFHVGALEYAGPGGTYHGYNDRVMIVKVNPKDAVSVPTNHSAQKLRVCRYEVVGEYEKPLDDAYDGSYEEAEESTLVSRFSLSSVRDETFQHLRTVVSDMVCIRDLNGQSKTQKYANEFEDYGHVYENYSHYRSRPAAPASDSQWGNMYTNRRLITNEKPRAGGNDSILICYNRDDSIRWISTEVNGEKKFYRFTNAR